MKLTIDTTEKTIQIEEPVDLDELVKEFGGKGYKIISKHVNEWQYTDYITNESVDYFLNNESKNL